ncbi:two-component system, sensor histidine kinase RpfC [Methylophilus rhizosphaerae]|uniref:Virulence sensor protein BvgS n=1 Tax=Methylophilus rhizosphaerae TaxID=492660 RepID=A0A1G8ZHA7_9PROT|nr:ATP-binding protein [Methylophilus rhizosphaerae]SDK14427.1 two-component system, sensor histidine kinase RpfC [Methylophilus rhizosphaerae]
MRDLFRQLKDKVTEIKSVSNETEQALIRVTFVSFITLYLLFNHSDIEPVAVCLLYLGCGFLMLFNILRNPQKNERRQWIAMIMDITATSLEQMISGAMAGIFIGIYLWLIIGYGLRYGTKFFKGCYALSLIGFSLTLYLSPYWNQHLHVAYGFLLTLLLVPPHTLRLQISLEKATKLADEANEAKTNFLSNISHEMRTPLNGIIGASELLVQSRLDQKQSELLKMVGTSATSLKKLINDVLDISKIEKGKIDLEEISFFLPDLIQRLQLMFQLEVERKQLWLRFHLDPAVERHYTGSLHHLEQVLMNLVANAIKFTQHGGVDVTVGIRQSHLHTSLLKFSIRDTGIGIKPDALPYIFDSFTQADSSITRRYGGTGLGTSIAKQLVELMGGHIHVSSDEASGTTFEVILPLSHAEAADQVALEEMNLTGTSNVVPLSSHTKFRKKIRVLIADDNVVNRMILNETLQRMHCVVKAAENGDEALDALEHHQFDLMILDYNMPEMNGLEVFNIYHALPGSKPLRTVILTADATKTTQDRCLRAGVYQVLTKPVVSRQIQALIETVGRTMDTESIALPVPATHAASRPVQVNTPASPAVITTLTPGSEPMLDSNRMAHLLKLGGSEAFLHRLITEFIDTTDDLMRVLGTECLDLNFEHVHKLAHMLAGESANMGLMPLSKQSRRLLGLAMEDAPMISGLYQAVMDAYEETRAQLHQYRSTLSSKRSNK